MSRRRASTRAAGRSIGAALVAGVSLFAAGGCQSEYRSAAKAVQGELARGNIPAAAERAKATFKGGGNERDEVVRALDAGTTLLLAGRAAESAEAFDAAYVKVRPFLDQEAETTISGNAAAVAVNQTMMVYKATPVERTLLNTFGAAAKLAQGDAAGARVEFNRANDWQRDAKERYARAMKRRQEKVSKEAGEKGVDVRNAMRSDRLSSLTQGLEDAQATAAFQSPFTSYLRATFLMGTSRETGDVGNARTDLRLTWELTGESTRRIIERDIESIDRQRVEPTTWVFVMSGLAPHREEVRIDVPIPVGEVNYVSAAFPKLESHEGNETEYAVTAGGSTEPAALLMDVEQSVKAEFKEELPTIIAEELLSSAVKAAATYGASNIMRGRDSRGNDWANLAIRIGGIIYQASTTAADLRSWRALPRRIMVARVPTPADGVVTLRAGAGPEQRLSVEAGKFNGVLAWQSGARGTAMSAIQWSMNP